MTIIDLLGGEQYRLTRHRGDQTRQEHSEGGRGRTIPGHKVGRLWRFHRETIDAWLTPGATPAVGKSS